MSVKTSLLAFAAAAGLIGAANAETIAITHAKIVTLGSAGQIADGTIIVKDGRIAAVGSAVAAPAGAKIIDAQGHMVTRAWWRAIPAWARARSRVNPAATISPAPPTSFRPPSTCLSASIRPRC